MKTENQKRNKIKKNEVYRDGSKDWNYLTNDTGNKKQTFRKAKKRKKAIRGEKKKWQRAVRIPSLQGTGWSTCYSIDPLKDRNETQELLSSCPWIPVMPTDSPVSHQ